MRVCFSLLILLNLFVNCSTNDEILDVSSNSGIFAPVEKPIRFTVDVDTSHPFLNQSERIETDWGVLILPKNYTSNGLSVPLVIGCHGGGGTVNSHTSQLETMSLYLYLVSKGYAVMDMAGMPEAFSKRLQIDHNRTVGSYVAVRSYEKGYEYVKNNFNIDTTGVFVNGGSNGGLVAINIVLHSSIPVKCQSGMSPLVSIAEQAWNLPSGAFSGGQFNNFQNRANIIQIYGMNLITSFDDLRARKFDSEKVRHFDPFYFLKNEKMEVRYPVPVKIWHPINDGIVDIRYSYKFINGIVKNGGEAYLVAMPGGEHSPEFYGPTIDIFEVDSKTYELKNAVKELYAWFELNRK